MEKQYFKNLKIIGRVFCLYNTRRTGFFTLYVHECKFYFKPKIKALKGQTINGVSNLVCAVPCQFGNVYGYQEAN